MSLVSKIQDVVTRIATEFKTAYGKIGTLANLNTTAKSDLVSAINEVKSNIIVINDGNAVSLTTTYSATQINAAIQTAVNTLINGADSSHDSFKKLQTIITNDETGAAALMTALNGCLRFDMAQTLTNGQKTQVATNGGLSLSTDIGDITTNFVTIFNAGLV